MNIYREIILDLYRNPLNFGSIANADVVLSETNQLCGDTLNLFFKFKNNKIDLIKFNGEGCAISIASASILTEMLKNKFKNELSTITSQNILDELGINPGPTRFRCATLGLEALKKII